MKHPYITITLSKLHDIYCEWYDYNSPYSDSPESGTQFASDSELHEYLCDRAKYNKGAYCHDMNVWNIHILGASDCCVPAEDFNLILGRYLESQE